MPHVGHRTHVQFTCAFPPQNGHGFNLSILSSFHLFFQFPLNEATARIASVARKSVIQGCAIHQICIVKPPFPDCTPCFQVCI